MSDDQRGAAPAAVDAADAPTGPVRRTRGWLVAIAIASGGGVGLVACSSGLRQPETSAPPAVDTSERDSIPEPAVTPGRDSTPDRDTAPREQQDAVERTTMVDLLARLPASAVVEQQGGVGQIALGDLAGAAELAGIGARDPSASDAEQIDRLVDLFDTGLILDASPYLFNAGFRDSAKVAAEVGFSALGIDTFASVFSPQRFDVFGDDLSLVSDLAEDSNGVSSAGFGEDFSSYPDQRTALRPDGVPLRLASADGRVAMSRSTPDIQSWAAGDGASAVDDADLRAAAETLDSADSISAFIFSNADFSFPFEPESDPPPATSVPFSTVGFGASSVDGELVDSIVYVFADASSAAMARAEIDDAWRNGELVNSVDLPTAIGDVYELHSVEQVDNTVLVTVAPSAEAVSNDIARLVLLAEPIVGHS